MTASSASSPNVRHGLNVGSVIVCYRPDRRQLASLCEHLSSDGSRVILVDNTEPDQPGALSPSGDGQLIRVGFNSGIAHAQNVGIGAALAANVDVIVFFDQDSTIHPGFLSALLGPLNLGKPDIVSPLYLDADSRAELPSLRVSRHGFPRAVHREGGMHPYPVDVIISSGTAATREVFAVAGNMDEALFIDFVDTEWCLRCRHHQIPIRVVPTAVMHQRIGSQSVNFGVTTVLVHSPIRCYYQLRNCFHLFRRRHVPLVFAMRETLTVFLNRLLLLLIVKNKRAYVKAYACALRDGLKGVTGAKPA